MGGGAGRCRLSTAMRPAGHTRGDEPRRSRWYESGLPIARIAEPRELDPKTVRERLDRAGVPRRRRHQAAAARLPEVQARAILAGLAEGATNRELARQHGVSRAAIQGIRTRHRIRGGRVMRRVRAALADRDIALPPASARSSNSSSASTCPAPRRRADSAWHPAPFDMYLNAV